jgi:hypothetical protein
VVIRTHFKQWQAKSVFHCHIPHEHTGMMQNFLIMPPGEGHGRARPLATGIRRNP